MRIKAENLFLIASLVLCALLLIGFIPTRYTTNQPHTTKKIQYVVRAGDTIWGVGERYYSDKEVRSFAEFMHDLRNQNGFKVGDGRKYLQVGEILNIEIKEKI